MASCGTGRARYHRRKSERDYIKAREKGEWQKCGEKECKYIDELLQLFHTLMHEWGVPVGDPTAPVKKNVKYGLCVMEEMIEFCEKQSEWENPDGARFGPSVEGKISEWNHRTRGHDGLLVMFYRCLWCQRFASFDCLNSNVQLESNDKSRSYDKFFS